MSFEDRVQDVEKNGKDTLIYANLRPAQNAAQWKTGEVVPFTLSMTFQLATNLTEYRAFDLNSMTFDSTFDIARSIPTTISSCKSARPAICGFPRPITEAGRIP